MIEPGLKPGLGGDMVVDLAQMLEDFDDLRIQRLSAVGSESRGKDFQRVAQPFSGDAEQVQPVGVGKIVIGGSEPFGHELAHLRPCRFADRRFAVLAAFAAA